MAINVRNAARQRMRDRLLVPLGTVLIEMAYGLLYAWLIFAPQLRTGAGRTVFEPGQSSWVFSIALFTLSAGAIASVLLAERFGGRKLALVGALLSCAGYVFAGFADHFSTHLFFVGGFVGFGIGLGFLLPLTMGFRWFPDRRGTFAGVAASSFVLGAFVWINAADEWFGLLNTLSFFSCDGVRSVFILFGAISAVMILLGIRCMIEPSPYLYGAAPPPPPQASSTATSEGLSPLDLIRTPRFAMLAVGLALSSLPGFTVINAIGPFGFTALKASGFESELAFAASGWAMASLFLMGIMGGVLWGTAADSIGSRWAAVTLCVIQGFAIFLLYQMGGGAKPLIFAACVVGAGVTGIMAVFPVLMVDWAGGKRFALIYALMLPVYALAETIGSQLGGAQPGQMAIGKTVVSSDWFWTFWSVGLCCLSAAVVLYLAEHFGEERRSRKVSPRRYPS